MIFLQQFITIIVDSDNIVAAAVVVAAPRGISSHFGEAVVAAVAADSNVVESCVVGLEFGDRLEVVVVAVVVAQYTALVDRWPDTEYESVEDAPVEQLVEFDDAELAVIHKKVNKTYKM